MIQPETARILTISRTDDDRAYMEDFFERTTFAKPDFAVGKFVPADKYDFIVFDARSLPPATNIETFAKLPGDIQKHYFLLDRYLNDTSKYVLFFGKFYYLLNQERCPSANSKFTLFARIRELIEFINLYRTE